MFQNILTAVKLAIVLGFLVSYSHSVPMHIASSYESNESNLDDHNTDICSQICLECLSDQDGSSILVRYKTKFLRLSK
jgi:hypothetical protein